MRDMMPARGPSIAELHDYFKRAREAFEAPRGGFDRDGAKELRSKCALFANRLIRAPAVRVAEILLKLEAFDWLELDARQAVEMIRADLHRASEAGK